MSVEHTISRPYAKAIFEIAVSNDSIQEWKEILIFISTISSFHKIKKFLSGSLSPACLSNIFITIGGDLINEHARNLIKILSQNQRLILLDNILEQFLELETYHKKILIVELKTAFLLKEKQMIKIRQKLEKHFLSKIQFIYKIDDYILDGMIIKVNNTVFNLSVRNHLEQLSDALNF